MYSVTKASQNIWYSQYPTAQDDKQQAFHNSIWHAGLM